MFVLKPDFQVQFASVPFKNPVIAASGTFGVGYQQHFDLSRLGGICTKGLTLQPKCGNNGIRIWETASGIMNSIGLENIGIRSYIKQELPYFKKIDVRIIANISGSTIEEYIQCASIVSKEAVDMIELNISCPNVKEGGLLFGLTSERAREVIKQVRQVTGLPLMVKLSPNAENIIRIARCCEEEGADGISLVNTFKAMAIDIKKRKPVFNHIYAGLSGPAIKPIALRMVHEVCQNVTIPVMGLGGICSGQDALEFIMAGATCIQVGTANFMNPYACLKIMEEISHCMNKEGIQSLDEIRGIL
jgi:dihydroorotate dehydrogenase (NAD+) catalytic subunit